MKVNTIEIPIHPKPAPRITHQGRFTKKAFCYYAYKEYIKMYCAANNFSLSEKIRITFYIPIGKSISKKERAKRLGNPHKFRPDLGNLIKAVEDALLEDDSAIWYYEKMQKIWSETGKIVVENVV